MFLENTVNQQEQFGWIEVICGSMFSGKTEELIRRLKRAQFAKSLLSDFEDFEDAVQYNSAIFQDCSLIITRDKKGFKNAKISVLSPIEFLASLKK